MEVFLVLLAYPVIKQAQDRVTGGKKKLSLYIRRSHRYGTYEVTKAVLTKLLDKETKFVKNGQENRIDSGAKQFAYTALSALNFLLLLAIRMSLGLLVQGGYL